ncbi:hypothetical protein T492DRAFT_1027535 [Pavlovales sp. CCMP2436]|nr:hypothetical protein T492DRAFT_1027535 [Pavlovales sp. CCMP2436]
MPAKRRESGGGSKVGKAKFAATVETSSERSATASVRRRVEAQRTRLARAGQRAKGDVAATLTVALDGAGALAEHAIGGDELAAKLRLAHLRDVHAALVEGGASAVAQREACVALHAPLVLALLDDGNCAEARTVLEAHPGLALPARHRTIVAFSRALVEFVERHTEAGSDDEAEAREEGEEKEGGKGGAAEELGTAGPAEHALDEALACNPYVGVFLAHLDVYSSLIDPNLAEAALGAVAVDEVNGGGGKGGKAKVARVDDAEDGESSEPHGAYEGSVEEALAYVANGLGPWLDFLEEGVERWVASRLEVRGEVEWPPRRCSASGARFQLAFVQAAAAAAEADEMDDEEGSGEEEGEETDEEERA